MAPAEIDVVLVSYNGADLLSRALASLATQSGPSVRCIVVDNQSGDRSCEVAEESGATVVLLPDNVGYGAAFNQGLARATAEWVVCSNQDVEVMPGTLATLVREAERYEREEGVACVVAPQLTRPDGSAAERCHRFPTLGQQIVAFMFGEGRVQVRDAYPPATAPQRCHWVSGAFLLARASTFRRVGGFDASYFMYFEDLEFFTRLSREGMHCVWVPGAEVVHHGGAEAVSPALYAHTLWNCFRYYRTESGVAGGVAALSAGVVGSLLRGGMWWARSLRSGQSARRMALMFSGGALKSVAWAVWRPARPTVSPAGSDRPGSTPLAE